LIRPLLFPVPFASALGVAVAVVLFARAITLDDVSSPSPSLAVGGVRNLSQAEIVFPSRRLLRIPQDIGDQFFWYVDPPLSRMVQYFFDLESASHEFHPVKPNDCGFFFFHRRKRHKAVLQRLAVGSSGHAGRQGLKVRHGSEFLGEVFVLGEFAEVSHKNCRVQHRIREGNVLVALPPDHHFHHVGISDIVVVDHRDPCGW